MSNNVCACLMAAFLLVSGGCVGAKPPAAADLANGIFVLSRVGGASFISEFGTPELGFDEGMRVYGGFCNRFTGAGTFVKDKLVVSEMASTRMLCPDDDLNELESRFFQMLAAGVDLTLEGRTLTLRQGEDTLVYVRGGWGSEPR